MASDVSTFPMTEFLIVAMLSGNPRKVAKVSFVRKDASTYIVPYGPAATERYACTAFPAGVRGLLLWER